MQTSIPVITRVLSLFLVLLFLPATGLVTSGFGAQQLCNVAYSGVLLSGGKDAEQEFPVYRRNKIQLGKALKEALETVNDEKVLPFNLIFYTDIESRKSEIDNTLSLAIVVMRDDVNSDIYNTKVGTINKTVTNVGLSAIIYDTREMDNKKRNTVVFSLPLVGFSQRIGTETVLDETEIDRLFIQTAVETLRNHIAKRLAGLSIGVIPGTVVEVDKDTAEINIGANNGLVEGQNVCFLKDGKKVCRAPITKLGRTAASVKLPDGFRPSVGMEVNSFNIRGLSEETFQVTAVDISSKKAAGLFPPGFIKPRLAQWFSGLLSERAGKVVLPSRVGGEWDATATANSFKLLDKDGIESQFELPPPKYPVELDISGFSSKIAQSNNVSDLCMYKAWLKVSIPTKGYSKEFDLVFSKSVVKEVQSYQEKDEFLDLLYQLTAKTAREVEI